MTTWDKPGVAECIDALWARPGEEKLREDIADWIGRQPGRRKLVDVGCGSARIAPLLSTYQYVGVDPSQKLLALAPESAKTQKVDAGGDLPFDDHSVPTVLCTQVFRHLATYGPTLTEIARIAKQRVFVVDIFSDGPTARGEVEVCGQKFRDITWALEDVLTSIAKAFPDWSVSKRTFGVPFIVGLKVEAPKT